MHIEFISLVRHKCFKNFFTWVKHKFKYTKKSYLTCILYSIFLFLFTFPRLFQVSDIACHTQKIFNSLMSNIYEIHITRETKLFQLIFDIFTNAKHEWYIYRKTPSHEWKKFHTQTSKALYLLFTVLDFYLVFYYIVIIM